jgi:DNA-binding winged helix-turn-helix (wHTH) protein
MKKPDGGNADILFGFGPFVADPVRGLLRCQGDIVALTPKAFDVLMALLERRGEIVEK